MNEEEEDLNLRNSRRILIEGEARNRRRGTAPGLVGLERPAQEEVDSVHRDVWICL